MKILLDTHYLLWAFFDTKKIDTMLYQQFLSDDNEVFFSQASLWEISIKYNLGKLVFSGLRPEDFYNEVKNSFLKCQMLSNEDLITFYQLPVEHKDPFDRIMIWQAIKSEAWFCTSDAQVASYVKYGLKVLS